MMMMMIIIIIIIIQKGVFVTEDSQDPGPWLPCSSLQNPGLNIVI
jgi:hypothetical protein